MAKGEIIKKYQEKQVYINKAREAEKKYGIPENTLVGLLAQESGHFDPKVISGERKSYAGAVGIGQFMPKTAKEYGIDPLNIDQAIDASAKYLSRSYKNLGNWDDAILSYNAGEGRVREYRAGKPIKLKEHQEYVGRVKNQIDTYGGTKSTFSKNVAPYMNQSTTPVTNFDIQIDSSNFASVPDSPQKEETEKKEEIKPIDKLKEQAFIEEYKSFYPEQEVAQQPQEEYQPIEQVDLEGIYNQVSQFVEAPMQQGGQKKPIIVNSKNDPRYRAYQDSLKSYNNSVRDKNESLDYAKRQLVILNNNRSLLDKAFKDKITLVKKKSNYNIQTYPGGIKPLESYIYESSDGKNAIGAYDVLKKPQQPVEVRPNTHTDRQGNTFSTGDNKLTGEPQLVKRISQIQPREIQVPLQQLQTQGVISQSNQINTPTLNITPRGVMPKSWDITDTNNQKFGGGDTSYTLYPDTLDTIRELPKEGWDRKITPNYQMGGEIIKDNNGYWNPNNWGKTVEISGGDITMQGVNQPLEGYSPETGERKLMLPNFDYNFPGAKRVIETPLKQNELAFLKALKNK